MEYEKKLNIIASKYLKKNINSSNENIKANVDSAIKQKQYINDALKDLFLTNYKIWENKLAKLIDIIDAFNVSNTPDIKKVFISRCMINLTYLFNKAIPKHDKDIDAFKEFNDYANLMDELLVFGQDSASIQANFIPNLVNHNISKIDGKSVINDIINTVSLADADENNFLNNIHHKEFVKLVNNKLVKKTMHAYSSWDEIRYKLIVDCLVSFVDLKMAHWYKKPFNSEFKL